MAFVSLSPKPHASSSIDIPPPPLTIGDPEGDTLPPYTNNIRLATLCFRKREFRAAFDKTPRGRRTWELVWLVLDGTALRVYKAEREEKSALEHTDVGLSRIGSDAIMRCFGPSAVDRSPRTSSENNTRPLAQQHPGAGRSSPSVVSPLNLASLGSSHMSLPQFRQDRRGSVQKALPPPYSNPSQAASYSTFTPPITSFSAQGGPVTPTPDFSKRKFSRQYPLQHAVCMKADSYTKRDHVLRFILQDGKQFLVQLFSRAETAAWLQLMSIAAPLSLDLDERPMPEPAHYPRRRPRPRASRRPSTAPGALQTGPQAHPFSSDSTVLAPNPNGSMLREEVGEEEVEEEVDDGQEMDHLPPARRPEMIRSLSSVDQARRLGIQI